MPEGRATDRVVARPPGVPDAPSGPAYEPPWWFRGRHLQTLWGPLLRRSPAPAVTRERWDTPDGDFVDLDWLSAGRGPLVLLLHGLEGSSTSHYVRGLLREVAAAGGRAVVLNFRSCSGEINRRPPFYHSGDTRDLDWVVGRLAEREHGGRVGIVGVSLGGNVALKWLGELGDTAPAHVRAAVAISTPFDLAACAGVLDRGLPRVLYTRHFLRTLKAKLQSKRALLHGTVDFPTALRARTFTQYDRHVTAPINGFTDEQDYWTRSSSAGFLAGIRRPCLLINAENDPFIPAASLPRAAVAASRWLEARFIPTGGHAGFLERGGRSWAEREALAFLRRHLGAGAPTP
jgi:uncharacterized protein